MFVEVVWKIRRGPVIWTMAYAHSGGPTGGFFKLERFYEIGVNVKTDQINNSCYSNGSDSPHRRRLTDVCNAACVLDAHHIVSFIYLSVGNRSIGRCLSQYYPPASVLQIWSPENYAWFSAHASPLSMQTHLDPPRIGSSLTMVRQIPSLLFPSLPLAFRSLFPPIFLPLPFPSLYPIPPVRSMAPLNTAIRSGERCKLSQRGLGRSLSRNRLWCISALQSDNWWHQIY